MSDGRKLCLSLLGAFGVFFLGGFAIFSNTVVTYDPAAPTLGDAIVVLTGGDLRVQEGNMVVELRAPGPTKADAVTALYIDGKLMGQVKGKAISMGWDIEKAAIYTALSYIGLIDEMALFDRALTAAEVGALQKKPGMLSALKKPAK